MVDSIILDKNNRNAESYTWEHVIPADETVRNIISYILELPFADKPITTRENLVTLFEQSKISILPNNINSILNTLLQSQMDPAWRIGDDPYKARYFNGHVLKVLRTNGIVLKETDKAILSGTGKAIKEELIIDFEARKNDLNNKNKQEAILLSLPINQVVVMFSSM